MKLSIVPVNYRSASHRWAVVNLLESYAGTAEAAGVGMGDDARSGVVAMLEGFPTSVVLLAVRADEPVGLAVCIESFSTFAAKPLLNLHDLVIAPNFRGQGIGKQLMDAVEEEAERRGCCAITLEVLGDNLPAMKLYRACGFEGGESIRPADTPMFWKKTLG